MATPQQADADPVEVVIEWLESHPVTTDALGGPDHISGALEAPWPHLIVTDGAGGDLRLLQWDAEYEVSLELVASPEGMSESEMRRTLMRIIAAVAELDDIDYTDPTKPVVCGVRGSGVTVWQPLANGQQKLIASVYITITPPQIVAGL